MDRWEPDVSGYLPTTTPPMPTISETALSDCSYPESTVYSIRDEISTTIARLKEVMDEEATLCIKLRALFVRRKEEALQQVRVANQNLDLINAEEKAFCEDVKQAAVTANKVNSVLIWRQ
jgi:hypothetical protein